MYCICSIYMCIYVHVYIYIYIYPVYAFLCDIFICNSIKFKRLTSIDFGTVHSDRIVVVLLHNDTFYFLI